MHVPLPLCKLQVRSTVQLPLTFTIIKKTCALRKQILACCARRNMLHQTAWTFLHTDLALNLHIAAISRPEDSDVRMFARIQTNIASQVISTVVRHYHGRTKCSDHIFLTQGEPSESSLPRGLISVSSNGSHSDLLEEQSCFAFAAERSNPLQLFEVRRELCVRRRRIKHVWPPSAISFVAFVVIRLLSPPLVGVVDYIWCPS